jgi:hypothetical protein
MTNDRSSTRCDGPAHRDAQAGEHVAERLAALPFPSSPRRRARRWYLRPGMDEPTFDANARVAGFTLKDLRRALSFVGLLDRNDVAHLAEELGCSMRQALQVADDLEEQGFVTRLAKPGRLSSLIFCGACGGKMVICGGSGGNSYYRCEAHNKRGTCKNDLSVRESVLRESLLDEIRHRLASDDGIRYARKRITEALAKLARESGETRRQHRERMEKLEAQITRVVDCIAEGTGPAPALRERLRVLEREVDAERRAFAAADAFASKPIKLPTPKEMITIIFDLDRRLMVDATRGREELRRFFRDGRIDQPGRFYIARSEILPLVLLTQGEPGQNGDSVRYTGLGCAGRI